MRKISIIISSLLLMLITFTKVNSYEKFSSWIIEFKKKVVINKNIVVHKHLCMTNSSGPTKDKDLK